MQDTELISDAMVEILRLGDLFTPVVIRVFNSLGIADCFVDGPATAEVLAVRLSTNVELLTRLLNVLTVLGVLSQNESKAFSLTDIGHVMRTDHPLSMKDSLGFALTEMRSWTQLEYCVRTGRSGFERSYGETHRSYRSHHPDEDIRMDRIHRAATRLDMLTLSRAYDWSEVRTVVDIGGGTGTFLATLLHRYPRLQGTLFDLPRMIARADEIILEYGVSDRCMCVGGDFFNEVPNGGDIYVLKAVLGGWNDADCVRILTTLGLAMRPDSRLLIIEPVMGVGHEFPLTNLVQLHLLVLYGGKYRTLDDYESLAEAANLQIRRVIPRSTLPILELTLTGNESERQ